MKLLPVVLALLLVASSCSALEIPEGPNVDITAVDFYPSGAKFTFSISPKDRQGNFEAIIPGAFQEDSIRAVDPDYIYGDIKVERRARTRWTPSQLAELKAQVDSQDKVINSLNAKKASLEQTLALLKASNPDKSKPEELLTYIKEAQNLRLEAENELAELKVKITQEQEKQRMLTNELNSRRPLMENSYIVVTGEGAGDVEFEAFTNAASWSPKYTMDLNTDSEKIETKMYVRLSQRTGLNYEGDITLHTKNPDENITTPDLEPLRVAIKPKQETIAANSMVSLQRTNRMYKSAQRAAPQMMALEAADESEEDFAANELAAPKAPAVKETLSDRTLEVDGLITGDGAERELEVQMSDLYLSSKVVLTMIPEQRANAWIIASMDEDNEHLIPGIADLRVDGHASGRIYLEEYGVGQKRIPFGYADQITIKKEALVEKTGVSWFSGVFTSGYKLEITNGTKEDKLITIKDRLPIPTDDKIKLEVKRIEPKEKERDKENRLTWEITVPASGTIPVIVDYTLSYPSGEELLYR